MAVFATWKLKLWEIFKDGYKRSRNGVSSHLICELTETVEMGTQFVGVNRQMRFGNIIFGIWIEIIFLESSQIHQLVRFPAEKILLWHNYIKHLGFMNENATFF